LTHSLKEKFQADIASQVDFTTDKTWSGFSAGMIVKPSNVGTADDNEFWISTANEEAVDFYAVFKPK